MWWLLFFIGIVLTYLVLLWVVPKGNVLHEILHLLPLWYRISKVPVDNQLETKFTFGKHPRQYFLFFQPKNKMTNKQNVIVYFHGGGWQFGSPERLRANAQLLVNEGYCVFMPSYRRLPFYNYFDIRKDLSTALLKIFEVMEENGLAGKKIILGGMSAGGNLAALLFYDHENLEALGLSPKLFSGIFLLGAPLDLRRMRPSPSLYFFAGNRNEEQFQKANPINYLKKADYPPALIIQGTADGFVEFEVAVSFFEKLNEISPGSSFLELEKVSHLGVAAWFSVNNETRKSLFQWLETRENNASRKIRKN